MTEWNLTLTSQVLVNERLIKLKEILLTIKSEKSGTEDTQSNSLNVDHR